MFGLIKKIFIKFLTGLVNECNHTKCVPLSSQKPNIQPTVTNLHPDEYSQEFHYYPFAVKLDRCVGSCNTLNDLSNKVCVPNKTEDLNLSVFDMITGTNESKTLAKHLPCECKCRFDGKNVIEINGGIMTHVDVTAKRIIYAKKIMFGILLHVIMIMENI